MNEKQLRAAALCVICGKPFGHAGSPLFWRLSITRYCLNSEAVQRQTGLAMMMGGRAGLAMVMGPDEEMAEPVGDKLEMTICENCAVNQVSVAHIAETAFERADT